MQILLSCSKDMNENAVFPPNLRYTNPMFQKEADNLASILRNYSVKDLASMLKVNDDIAELNYFRYQDMQNTLQPAIYAYSGIAYKYLDADSLDMETHIYAQKHLWITSFLYGISRPLDMIRNHRLEGNNRLKELGGKSVFDYWKPFLTDCLIESVKSDDGILLNVASAEMKNLFDWKRVLKEVQVIEPEFVTSNNGKLKTIVVYAKMCRGAMARYVIENKMDTLDALYNFSGNGFRFLEEKKGKEVKPVFVKD